MNLEKVKNLNISYQCYSNKMELFFPNIFLTNDNVKMLMYKTCDATHLQCL